MEGVINNHSRDWSPGPRVIEYLPGEDNVVADSLSRVDALSIPTDISLQEFSEAQKGDQELAKLCEEGNSSLNLKKFTWGPDHTSVICNVLGETLRPYVPPSLRKRIIALFHNQAHPRGRVMDRIIRKRYVWPAMNKEIKEWFRVCLGCQK